MKAIVLMFIGSLWFSCARTRTPESKTVPPQSIAATQPDIRSEVFESIHKGYGYRVFINQKPVVEQPNIPVVHGLHGFKTREDARCVAECVKKKVEAGEMPPTVTLTDLQNCGISLPE